MADIMDFPAPLVKADWLIGPFEEWRVIVDGRIVPSLTGRRLMDAGGGFSGRVALCVDHRFWGEFSSEADAQQAAWLIGQASAIHAGYAHLGAPNKDRPFAAQPMLLDELPHD